MIIIIIKRTFIILKKLKIIIFEENLYYYRIKNKLNLKVNNNNIINIEYVFSFKLKILLPGRKFIN